MDWLNAVCRHYNLMNGTIYLTANLIDRYLSLVSVNKSRLQLLGITCLFIASKCMSIQCIAVNDCVYITDESCRRDEILKLEQCVLAKLEWNVTPVLSTDFLDGYFVVCEATPIIRSLSHVRIKKLNLFNKVRIGDKYSRN
jgi:hypothetical protein